MPKRLVNEIKLSKFGNYQLWEENPEGLPYSRSDLEPDSAAYFQWLATLTSFRFAGKEGHFTARREMRQQGYSYWYAYRHQGKQFRQYLGTTDKLTLAHLEDTARALAALSGTQEKKKAPHNKPVKRAVLIDKIADKDKAIEDLQAQVASQAQQIKDLKLQIKMYEATSKNL